MNSSSTSGSEHSVTEPTVEEYAEMQYALGYLEVVNRDLDVLQSGDLDPAISRLKRYLDTGK